MKLIFLCGLPGVGKLTVARELEKLTRFKLFHNHLTVDLVWSLFEFGSEPFVKMREAIWLQLFAEAVKENFDGLIFTFAFDRTVRRSLIPNLRRIVEDEGAGEVLFVELYCSDETLADRVTAEERSRFGKLNSLAQFRELSQAGAFVDPGIPVDRLRLDTTNLTPFAAARWITSELEARARRSIAGATAEAESIHEAYSRWAATYDEDRNRTRDLDESVTARLLGAKHLNKILEIGCGTGKNTILLSQIGKEVVALDFSEEMLSRAKGRLREHTNVEFRLVDITRPWGLEDATFDLVTCNLVLEHIKDLGFIFSEASRCLRTQGEFLVSELHPFRQYLGTKANFRHDETTTEIPAFVHNVTDFLNAAHAHGLRLERFDEWWHEEDQDKPPRIASFIFKR
jgi:malonyl-CoA O-methyltransferase